MLHFKLLKITKYSTKQKQEEEIFYYRKSFIEYLRTKYLI